MGGLSVHHICIDFRPASRRVYGSDGANVYEVEPTLIRPVGAKVHCPRDGMLGASYVDCKPSPDDSGVPSSCSATRGTIWYATLRTRCGSSAGGKTFNPRGPT